MATGEAFCEEAGRNVTITEARDIYFAQPEPRLRLNFKCGDHRCRAFSKANVIGANYDKEENSELKIQSPHFRENYHHAHISTCTWVESGEGERNKAATRHNKMTSKAAAENGMIFRPFSRKKRGSGKAGEPLPDENNDQEDGPTNAGGKNGAGKSKRPESSRFVATVAMNHLRFTDDQRKSAALAIEGAAEGTFSSICMPINGFYPAYQNQRIYYGRCKVVSLDYVFLLKFRAKISPIGDKKNRETEAQVKLQKKWLDGNYALLADELEKLAISEEWAWCYFYSLEQPDVKEAKGVSVARFSVVEPGHIAVIPIAELTEPEPREPGSGQCC